MRGELWTVAGGAGFAGKPRPTLIVQADLYENADTVAICGLTTEPSETRFTRPLIEPQPANGLRQPSRVMIDKITTVPRTRLGKRLGSLDAADLRHVDRALLVFLGLSS